MSTPIQTLSPLVVEIFTAVKASRPNAIFLCDGAEDHVLAFGACCTHQFRYQVALNSGGKLVSLSSDDHTPTSIFLDQLKNGAVRLVIYANGEEMLTFTSDNSKNHLLGHIFIEGHEPNGPDRAVIHAAFGGKDASLIIDASPELLRHLDITTKAWAGREGGNSYVDIFNAEKSLGLESSDL